MIVDCSTDFLDEEEESEFAERLAVLLMSERSIARNDILPSDFLYWEYRPDLIQDILNQLSVDKMHLTLVSSWYEDCTRKRSFSEVESSSSEDLDSSDDENATQCSSSTEDNSGSDVSEEVAQFDLATYDKLYTGSEKYRGLGMPSLFNSESSPLKIEEHFGINFWEVSLNQLLLTEWLQSKERAALHLPKKNTFVPSDLSLFLGSNVSEFQRLDCVHPYVTLWYQSDVSFRVPKIELRLHIITTYSLSSARAAMLNDLWCRCACDCLTDTLYLASLAGLGSSVASDDMGITIQISGYSDRAFYLLDAILHQFLSSDLEYASNVINRQIEYLQKSYSNSCMKAFEAANEARALCLTPDRISSTAHLEALHKALPLTNRDLHDHAASILRSEIFAKCMVLGNISADEAQSLQENLSRKLTSTSKTNDTSSENSCPMMRVVDLPSGISIVHCSPTSSNETNSAVQIYFQHGAFELQALAILNLIEHIVDEPYFNQLRTNMQVSFHR